MNPTKMAEKQRFLARTAKEHPDHRFANLYDLLHWDDWMHISAERVLARPGSQTDGVDNVTRAAFKKDYESQRTALIDQLKRRTYEPQPVRRVYIPKRDGKRRPLGIPALRDRIVQEALRAILDPIYESDFYRHSYGFRKGRRTMDAIGNLMPLFYASAKHYYVIEGDLQSYFDTVHHRTLMKLLRRRLKDRALLDLIWKFLKSGVMEGGLFRRTNSGVPQGGVISPLLANVYLNEFDQWAAAQWDLDRNTKRRRRQAGLGNYKMVRYADDFVVVSNGPIAEVKATKQAIQQFLENELHLTLSEEKTVITHVNDGFDFLGFNIQRKQVSGSRWVVHLRPTVQARERVKRRLKDLTSRSSTWTDEYTRLKTLNATVRGWAEYYRYTSLVRDIEEICNFAWFRYLYWLRKKHKGSHKGQLVRAKSGVLHGRTRWRAEVREGGNTLTMYQWLPTSKELARGRYLRKGEADFPHPYLSDPALAASEHPQGETGPDERIYTTTTRSSGIRGEPREIVEQKLRAKVRDGMKCQKCGARAALHVHHTKGTKSHALRNLVTLCRTCHQVAHRPSQQQTV